MDITTDRIGINPAIMMGKLAIQALRNAEHNEMPSL